MNVANILKVADAIEQHSIPGLGFNMKRFFDFHADIEDDKSGHNCGTTACIGGWACALAFPENYQEYPWVRTHTFTEDFAQDYMGLTYDQAKSLMLLRGVEMDATPTQAIRTLRHLAATGEVNWDLPEPVAA